MPIASRRMPPAGSSLRRDDRDHAEDREAERHGAGPIEAFPPEDHVRDGDHRRVGVEAEQREGDGDPVEGDEHAQVEREAHDRGEQQQRPRPRSQVAQADQPGRAAAHPPGDVRGRADQADQRAPGDERQRAPCPAS